MPHYPKYRRWHKYPIHRPILFWFQLVSFLVGRLGNLINRLGPEPSASSTLLNDVLDWSGRPAELRILQTDLTGGSYRRRCCENGHADVQIRAWLGLHSFLFLFSVRPLLGFFPLLIPELI